MTSPNHWDFVAAVWAALGDGERGEFTVGQGCAVLAAREGVRVRCCRPTEQARRRDYLVLVASMADAELYGSRPFVLIEHGAGQAYSPSPPLDTTPSYDHRCNMAAFLAPNEQCAHRARLCHPHAAVSVVGSPKVERWLAVREMASSARGSGLPVVAFAWHWPSPLHPAAYWSFPFWQQAVADLAATPECERGFRIVGHGHPRAASALKGFYRKHGVEWWSDREVIAGADVVVFDSTSFGFEAAACGIPVVVLDAPWFDTDGVEFGLRFREFADVGVLACGGTVHGLRDAIARTLAEDPNRDRRAEVTREVFPIIDGSAQACADAIRSLR